MFPEYFPEYFNFPEYFPEYFNFPEYFPEYFNFPEYFPEYFNFPEYFPEYFTFHLTPGRTRGYWESILSAGPAAGEKMGNRLSLSANGTRIAIRRHDPLSPDRLWGFPSFLKPEAIPSHFPPTTTVGVGGSVVGVGG